MGYIKEKYVFIFSSSYHGYYIEDLLTKKNIKNDFRKAPRVIGKSCQAAIYINEFDLERAQEVIQTSKISPVGIYEIINEGKGNSYKRLDVK